MMNVKQQPSTRFASTAAAISPARLLVKNSGRIWKDYLYGKVYDIKTVRDNAFIMSSLIQVLSRIFVANQSAMQAKGTPHGSYRYKEAVKTTFREAMGFILTYVVLRAFQRGTIDFFRNYLWVRRGLSNAPTIINGLFHRLFRVPFNNTPTNPSYFPSFLHTLKRQGRQVFNFFTGKLEKVDLKPIDDLFPDVVLNKGVIIDPRRMPQYRKIEPWVDRINRLESFLTGNPIPESIPKKLTTFFNWAPVLIGSIPALLLSGLALERFSQTRAEPLAKRIAGYLGHHARQPDAYAGYFPYGGRTGTRPYLDHFTTVPYAMRQPLPTAHAGFVAYGQPFLPPRR